MATTFDALARALPGLVKDARETLMTRIVIRGEALGKAEVPVKRGGLRRSLTHRVEAGGNRGVVGTNLTYARSVHDGSKPHVIRPKRAKGLFWPGARHPVRIVNHPGNRPNPYFDRAASKLRPEAEREMQRAMNGALGRIV